MRESTHSDKEGEAKNTLKLREGAIARGEPITPKVGRVTFADAAADVVLDYKTNKKRSLADLECRINKHLAPFFGNRRLADIATPLVRQFIAARQEAKASAGEINRELAALKRTFNLAMQAGKILHKPHIPMLREQNVRTGFFEPAQYDTVSRHLPEAVRPVLAFAYITGWRVNSEVLGLEWRQVDFDAGTVRLDPGTTKNGDGRVFPMTAGLRELLEGRDRERLALQAKGIICPLVFHRRGKRIKSFRRVWLTACRLAGCPGRIPHDLRRTAVRNLVRAGIPERVAMTMTGHKTRSVFERYNIVSDGDLLEAARKLDVADGRTQTATVAL